MITRVEYQVTSSSISGWAIFRNDQQIGYRNDLFDAVAFATLLAEREAALPRHATRVAIEAGTEPAQAVRCSTWRHGDRRAIAAVL